MGMNEDEGNSTESTPAALNNHQAHGRDELVRGEGICLGRFQGWAGEMASSRVGWV
jgi:hypothetical protein